MPILDHTQRKHFSENVAYLSELRAVPLALLASKAMVDRDTLENWLDATQKGGIKNMGAEQLERIGEALGVESKSNLYSYDLSQIKERYGPGAKPARRKPGPKPRPIPEAASPSDPARRKPGPKPGAHYKRRAAAAPSPNAPRSAPSTPSIQSTPSTPSTSSSPSISSTLADSDLRAHFSALLDNPLVSFRDAVRLAYKTLFVPAAPQTSSGPKESNP